MNIKRRLKIVLLFLLFSLFANCLANDSGVDISANLVLYFKLDHKEDNQVLDCTKYGNNGTLYGPIRVKGKFLQGLEFDGKNDYIQVPDSNTLDLTKEFTVAAWVNLGKIGTGRQVLVQKTPMGKGDVFSNYTVYLQWTQGSLAFVIGDGQKQVGFLSNKGFDTPEKWHHVAVTLNTKANEVNFYIDGKSAGGDEVTLKPIANKGPLVIGGYMSRDGQAKFHFQGMLDELKIYNKALTQKQIIGLSQLYPKDGGKNLPPRVGFHFEPVEPWIGKAIQFIDKSIDPDGKIVSWQWDFGDGKSSRKANPVYKYSEPGTYKVSLTVTDQEGAKDTCHKKITITKPKPNQPPQAEFSFRPKKPRKDEVITFDASKSKDPDGAIKKYEWDFNGDGKADKRGKRVKYSFQRPGEYPITLTVVDNRGKKDSKIEKIQVLPQFGLAATPWPMYRHDPQHTGRSSLPGPDQPIKKWEYSIKAGSPVFPPVIGSEGTIYLGVDDHLYAFLPTGKLKWSLTFDISQPVTAPAISSDNTLYVGAGFTLYALHPDGTQKWKFRIRNFWLEGVGPIRSAPTIGDDGTIYIGAGAILYAINPDGSKKWEFKTDAQIQSSPAIGKDDTIYVGSNDKNLYAVNPDGTKKWAFETDSPVMASPSIGEDGTIYIGSGITLHALNPEGEQKWRFTTGQLLTYLVTPSPAIGQDGTIYFGSQGGVLYALDTKGRKKWEFSIQGRILYPPTIDTNGRIYATFEHLDLYALNPGGTQLWSLGLKNSILSSPVIAEGKRMYVVSEKGKLYALGEE